MSLLSRLYLALALALPAVALAEITEHLSYSYYELAETSSPKDLVAQLDKASPVKYENEVLHARTDWDVDWRVEWEPSEEDRCMISQIHITVDAVILLPSLSSEDVETQQQFNRYVRQLQVHEHGHYVIAMQAANAIVHHLQRLQGPCDLIEEQVDELAVAVLDQHTEREVRYDKTTRHGRDQDLWEW